MTFENVDVRGHSVKLEDHRMDLRVAEIEFESFLEIRDRCRSPRIAK
jgi:hypothetical protein